jgi:hypothetical protein
MALRTKPVIPRLRGDRRMYDAQGQQYYAPQGGYAAPQGYYGAQQGYPRPYYQQY